jgi:hypothetical protein
MDQEDKSVAIPLILVVLVGIVFQAIFIGIESKDTPNKAVIEFAKAYYQLDPSMSERLCDEMKVVDDVDMVDQHIFQVTEEGKNRGFEKNFMRSKLYHIDTYTQSKSDTQAQIRLTGKRRANINSVYKIIAQIFCLGAAHEVDKTFNVIKEGGKWKVCTDLNSI